jgi:hypothetical protein
MSRIGRKPIPLPTGVKYKVEGNTVLVEGPKGKVSALIADGISLKAADGQLHIERSGDDKAAVHGLTRALVNNAVEGVTKGWTRELDIVGIGYRAELKSLGTVVIGGMTLATLIGILMVPVTFSVVEYLSHRFAKGGRGTSMDSPHLPESGDGSGPSPSAQPVGGEA